jgi:hypothetical protein
VHVGDDCAELARRESVTTFHRPLFTDFNSTDYSAAASELTWTRALAFLE